MARITSTPCHRSPRAMPLIISTERAPAFRLVETGMRSGVPKAMIREWSFCRLIFELVRNQIAQRVDRKLEKQQKVASRPKTVHCRQVDLPVTATDHRQSHHLVEVEHFLQFNLKRTLPLFPGFEKRKHELVPFAADLFTGNRVLSGVKIVWSFKITKHQAIVSQEQRVVVPTASAKRASISGHTSRWCFLYSSSLSCFTLDTNPILFTGSP